MADPSRNHIDVGIRFSDLNATTDVHTLAISITDLKAIDGAYAETRYFLWDLAIEAMVRSRFGVGRTPALTKKVLTVCIVSDTGIGGAEAAFSSVFGEKRAILGRKGRF